MSETGEKGDLLNQFNIRISPAEGLDLHSNQYFKYQVAAADIGKRHLRIHPHNTGNEKDANWGGWDVSFYPDKDGQCDTSHGSLNSAYIDGTTEDIEEIALTFAQRLASGVDPKNMFVDLEEATIKSMRQILDRMKKEGIKPKRP